MRAAQITRFGDWRAVEVSDTPVPEAAPAQILIRVATTSINSVDADHRAGRLAMVTGRRLPHGLGIDAVGTVESLGGDVRGFEVGDRVWAIRSGAAGLKSPTGLAAEFAVVEARNAAHTPGSLDDIGAAALVVGAYTALRALRDVARVQPGERVLIRGGTGGVGIAAVQIATALGAHVAVLASARSEQLARSLGAQEFFDYASSDPRALGAVDVVFDTVGTELLSWRRTLKPRGRMVGVAFDSLAGLAAIAASTIYLRRRIRTFAGEPPAGYLDEVSRFVEAHGIRGVAHSTVPFARIGEAHRTFGAEKIHGKIVIAVAS